MSSKAGPAVERFWAVVERGEQPDVADLARRFPEEALTLAEAMRELAHQRSAQMRERMWAARNRRLHAQGDSITLGALLKQKRVLLGLSVEEVARRISVEGLRVASDAVRSLEDNKLSPVAVKPPAVWRMLASVLAIDSAQLISFLTLAVQGGRVVQQFTRMTRGSVSEEREQFLEESKALESDGGTVYLENVRRELGLATPGDHLRQ